MTLVFGLPRHVRWRIAIHESGHAVIGSRMGFYLKEVRLGFEVQGQTLIGGGAVFEAPKNDQCELAKRFPRDMAIVLMSGAAAEQVLMESGPLSNGWHKDFEIARIGLGWIYKGRDHKKDCLELFGQAKEAVRKDAYSVIRVAEALIGTHSLTGDEVASLMA